MASEDSQQELIKNLAFLLRENGEKILTGGRKLSLTTRCLSILNDCFSTISDDGDFLTSFEVPPPNSPRFPLLHDLQFLYDLVQKALALKILHSTCTVPGRVNLTPFRALETLEIKKTPLHLLQGLNKLRTKLRLIICTRCLSSLQELLEQCGCDMAAAMTWPLVETFIAQHNSISQLDNSLRLLPALRVLDLSFNIIQDTENHLQHLTELKALNISYNRLRNVPAFSISVRNILATLCISYNNLSSLQGVEALVNLRELDVSHNCISDHQTLQPLRGLRHLVLLHTMGNPIYYHKKHRLLTLEHTHSATVPKLKLDGKLVTQAEIVSLSKLQSRSRPSGNVPVTDDLRPLLVESQSTASFGSGYSLVDDTDSSTAVKLKRKRKGKKSARHVAVADTDDMEDSSPDLSLTSTPVQTSEHLSFRDHIENVRQHLGPDWLQTINTPVSKTANGPVKARIITSLCNKVVNASEDDLYLQNADLDHQVATAVKKALVDIEVEKDAEQVMDLVDAVERDSRNTQLAAHQISSNNPPTQSNTSHSASANTSNIPTPIAVSDEVVPPYEYTAPSGVASNLLDSTNPFAEDLCEETYHTANPFETEDQENFLSFRDDNPFSSDPKKDSVYYDAESVESYSDSNPFKDDKTEINKERKPSEEEFNWNMTKSDIAVDLGTESEPFIVTTPENADEQFIIVVTEAYLVEKDLNGVIMETLDLKLLQGVQNITTQALNDADLDSTRTPPVVKLAFNYIRRDRRERRYVMEDDDNAQVFLDLLAPVVEAVNEERKYMNTLHCLKCGMDFTRDQAHMTVKSSSGTLGTVYAGSYDTGHLEEGYQCPECYSSMLIQHDPELRPSRNNTSSSLTFTSSSSRLANESANELTASGTYSGTGETPYLTPSMSIPSGQSWNDAHSYKHVKFQIGGESLPKMMDIVRTDTYPCQSEQQGQDDPHALRTSNSFDNKRTRQDSVESDITVLSRQTSAMSYTDSDIAIISENKAESTIVTGHDLPVPTNGLGSHDLDPVSELSPCGSLTNKTLHSMIESIYEKSFYERKQNSSNSLASMGSTQSGGEVRHPATVIGQDGESGVREKGRIQYWYDDFTRIDHKLKLHFTMSVFQEDEEFKLLLRCGVVPFMTGVETPGLLLVSSKNIYVYSITEENSEEQPDVWLKQEYVEPITELHYVDIGLGYQSFRIEFDSAATCCTFLLREDTWCQRFIAQLTGLLQDTAFSCQGKLQGVTKNNPRSLTRLEGEVLLAGREEETQASEVDLTLLKYCLAYQHTGEVNQEGKERPSPVSVAVTASHICLATEDHRFPVPHCDTSDLEGQQFQLKDRQKVTDITHLDLYCQNRKMVTIHFVDEETSEQCQWKISMETEQCLESLVAAIRQPWEQQFGIPLQLNSEIS